MCGVCCVWYVRGHSSKDHLAVCLTCFYFSYLLRTMILILNDTYISIAHVNFDNFINSTKRSLRKKLINK